MTNCVSKYNCNIANSLVVLRELFVNAGIDNIKIFNYWNVSC